MCVPPSPGPNCSITSARPSPFVSRSAQIWPCKPLGINVAVRRDRQAAEIFLASGQRVCRRQDYRHRPARGNRAASVMPPSSGSGAGKAPKTVAVKMHRPAKIMVIVLISNAQFKRAGFQVKQNRAQFGTAATPSPRPSGERDGVRGFELEITRLLTPALSSTSQRRGRKMVVVRRCVQQNRLVWLLPFNPWSIRV